ncbi:MAG TPA: AEC family transporter [Clostridia bacterium]|nr:AEC family transporter [Clostridia bacterium]
MVFLNSIGSIFTIIILIATGFFLTRAGWFNEGAGKTFSKVIMNVSLPCYMLYNITSTFDKSELESMSRNLVVPVISIGICYLLSIVTSNIIKVDRRRKGVFRSMFFASNTMFIGLPVNLALFGEKCIPYVLLYYLANTSFYWTVGAYEVSRDNPENRTAAILNVETLKRVFNPAVIGFLTGVLLVLLNIRLPSFILDSSKYIGNLTTPLAMFFTGIVLYSVKFRDIRFDKDVIALLLARSVISPVLVLVMLPFFGVPALMGKVFVIQAAMPAITSTSVVAREYGSDYQFAALMTAITTVASLVVIPFYMWFMA